MRCKHKKKLSAYLDGELSERETWDIRQHLKDCAQCRDEVEKLMAVEEALYLLEELEPDPHFSAYVVRRAMERKPARGLHRVLVPAVATAVGVASIFLGGYLGRALYTKWMGETTEADFGEYFGVSTLQDYPPDSFGEVVGETLEEDDES